MKNVFYILFLVCFIPLFLVSSVFAADHKKNTKNSLSVLKAQPYSANRDIAFVSVMGSRPDSKRLQGFQWAILFNAQGRIVQKVNMKNDSIYSLDKMIQKNKTRGPLLIKMLK